MQLFEFVSNVLVVECLCDSMFPRSQCITGTRKNTRTSIVSPHIVIYTHSTEHILGCFMIKAPLASLDDQMAKSFWNIPKM